jgi:hypothetical protein
MIKKIWTWTCNQKTFFDKVDAIKESNNHNQPIYFCTPTAYDQFPWFQEPQQSWPAVLAERAHEIRDSSEHINLLYSGGCDSQTMLNTFIKNQIHIDEITCIRLLGDHASRQDADFEVNSVAVSYLNSLKKYLTKTKITFFDLNFDDYVKFYSNERWIEGRMKVPNTHRFRLTTEAMDQIFKNDSLNKSTILLGRDKPTILYVNNNWYCYFLDVDLEIRSSITDSNCVYFYADSPKVNAKQCHMLKNYLENTFKIDQYDTLKKIKSIDQAHINFGSGRLEQLNSAFIYKDLNDKTVVELKNKESVTIFNNKDIIAVQSISSDYHNMDNLLTKYKRGLENITAEVGKKWFNQGNPGLGSIGIFSKFYCLNAPNISTVDELFPTGFKNS